jgi:subtilisin family serine protease
MSKHLLRRIMRFTLAILLIACLQPAWSQNFKGGIRQGLVKVKFSNNMSETVSRMRVNATSRGLVTGIKNLDAKARQLHASGLYRLFPYDAKNESRMHKHGLDLWYVLEIDEHVDPRAAVLQLRELSEIEIAEVDREKNIAPYEVKEYQPGVSAFATLPFNDPYLKDQWHYDNTGQSGYGDADINLFNAWETTTGSSNIVVSVHDEGVDVKHEDLKSNIWINTDEVAGNGIDDDNNGYIDDINGYNFSKNKGTIDAQHHGTHVAGTIAAVNNNGKGVSGIAGGDGSGNGVKIMSMQILGGGLIERSYVYAANNGAVISQNSWGYSSEGYFDQSVLDAIKYFIAEAGNYEGSPMRGGIVIFAAGNSNLDGYSYPARYEPVFSVAATGPEWIKAAYSNYGTWVEISAPGGDQIDYPNNNGVLSTIPGNKYAYMQGTSMACPHVSGVAALVLANRTKQLTASELWNKLITGVVSIDDYNGEHTGKLGSGALDASLAIKSDGKIAPKTITDLKVDGIAQEFATLSWTVPNDEDDDRPASFSLYYHTQPITAENLSFATRLTIKNTRDAGDEITHEITGLLGVTTYYFTVTSADRWGNISILSNVPLASTNAGPAISASVSSIEMEIDASASLTQTSAFDILNGAEGILRWDAFTRHRTAASAFNVSGIHYPVATNAQHTVPHVAITGVAKTLVVQNEAVSLSSFTPAEKRLSYYPSNLVGETNTSIPNSAAARFYVDEEGGFNLTDVSMYLKHDPAKGPVVVEVYGGNAPVKENLLIAQEYSHWSPNETLANIVLEEQIYFEQGSTFWIAFHVPADNLFPLGIGYEIAPAGSANCFMSFNVGATWQPLEEALNDKNFAWVMTAGSYNRFLGTYLTLDPSQGDVNGNLQSTVSISADASQLVNGTYSANVVLASNDAAQRELRIPVNVTVTGHNPDVRHIDIADFGSVFIGEGKTVDIALDNRGYGNLDAVSYTIDGADFEIESSPYSIPAREQEMLRVTFKPTSNGNKNATLTFENGQHTYSISLFGVGSETSKIQVDPETQAVDDLTIGDAVTASITVQNIGAYPLKYFIPGFDSKGVSDNWPSTYHRYGYKVRSNRDTESNPISYEFVDISGIGVDITSHIITEKTYFGLDLGFTFPYYGESLHRIYVAQKGFTTFDDSVRPLNTPNLGGSSSPAGYISPLGTFLTYIAEGKVFYQLEADRLIIQYDHVTDGSNGNVTAQMVLFSNGDIRFYYEDLSFPEWTHPYFNILIEDLEKSDGILIHNYEKQEQLYSGLAIGFDYPGPDIITNITNGSGILAPGGSANVEVSLSTASLAEGTVNRYVNIISNDPLNRQKIALVQLNINDGGTATPVLSADNISFGDVFQGAVKSHAFTIKNEGTAAAEITSITLTNGAFTISGETSASIKPGLIQSWGVQMPTDVIASLTDVITIQYGDGSTRTIDVSGNVIAPPAISVDLSAINETLAFGETKSIPFSIANNGAADLKFSAVGERWIYFESAETPSTESYEVQKENIGGIYQWHDIRKTGVQLPFSTEPGDESQYWRNLTLPFTFEYFGNEYTSLKIGENGVISFEEAPPVMQFSDGIPSNEYPGAYIMPYWAFAGFDTYTFKKEDVGIFYQSYPDKVIITWSYLVNFFGGMGDPVSAQVILYKNGMIKFQYRVEESGSDQTSTSTIIGLQKNTGEGILISDRLALDYGKGLAYVILPSEEFTVAPSVILSGEIIVDATHTYGGNYTSALKIATNVPGNGALEKPAALTVNGLEEISHPENVAFGEKIIAFESGMPVAYPLDVKIANSGTTPIDISWIQSASGGANPFGLQLYALIDGWFGPSWEWVDVSFLFSEWNTSIPVFQVMPGDTLIARAVFYPTEAGEFDEQFTITTSIGERTISFTGTAVEAPVLGISTQPVYVMLNASSETATRSIAIDNINGKSPLEYSIAIDFDRVVVPQANELMASGASYGYLKEIKTSATSGIISSAVYNRTIKHTERTAPDYHIGADGSEPFVIATKFNAGNRGFNLSHIETWFRAETMTEGDVEVEVRAGSSITESSTLIQTKVHFNRSGEDQSGNWMQLPLDHAVFIYPNEDFFVVLTYPFEINFPQGSLNNASTSPGRYLYAEAGAWRDIQNEEGFFTTAWLMYAAEQTEQTMSWINITSPAEGSLAAEQQSAIELSFAGLFASAGDQLANVIITTNDPDHEQVVIPVKLHVNEAPRFANVPDETILSEQETVVVELPVSDPENHTITVSSEEGYDFVTSTFENGLLTVTFTPSYGDEGIYEVTFTAMDEFNAARSATLNISIQHKNQAPVFIGDNETIILNTSDNLVEYRISDFFSDPDNDAITFTAISTDTTVAEIFASADKLMVAVKKNGNFEIGFIVSDAYGAITEKNVSATVNAVLATEGDLLSRGVRVFPNPAHEHVNLEFDQLWRGEKTIEVTDARGEKVASAKVDGNAMKLAVNHLAKGLYLLKVTTGERTITRKIFIK